MEEFSFVKHLGAGTYGYVFLVKHIATGQELACKRIRRGDDIDESVFREVNNLRALGHQTVVGFHSVVVDRDHLNILMEAADEGDLHALVNRVGRLSEDAARYFFQQLVCALAHLEAHQIVHADLKLDNVLLQSFRTVAIVKLADFGHSYNCNTEKLPELIMQGPACIAYIAPEIHLAAVNATKASDVWSLGVCLYLMLVGKYPTPRPATSASTELELRSSAALDFTLPDAVGASEECKDLLARMLSVNPASRITISEIQRHPWYRTRLAVELLNGFEGCERFPRSEQTAEEVEAILHAALTAGTPEPLTVTSRAASPDSETAGATIVCCGAQLARRWSQ